MEKLIPEIIEDLKDMERQLISVVRGTLDLIRVTIERAEKAERDEKRK